MAQCLNHWVSARDMVRSRAWREGYEAARRNLPPTDRARRDKALAYEYGRLTAAFLRGEGAALERVPTTRPMHAHQVPVLAAALERVLSETARQGG